MAKRPLNVKRANRVRKAFRSDLPRWIDLIQWLKDHRYAQTTGEAEKIILAGRVRVESHKLGIKKAKVPKRGAHRKLAIGRPLEERDYEERDTVDRFIPATLRDKLTVV